MIRKFAIACLSVALSAVAYSQVQEEPPEVVGGSVRTAQAIAVPAMPGDVIGRQVAEVIASDLRSTGLFTPLGPSGLPSYSVEEAGNPAYPS
jgi:TolB protein